VSSARVRVAMATGLVASCASACIPRSSGDSGGASDAGQNRSAAAREPKPAPRAQGAAGADRHPERDRPLDGPWRDDFERTSLGEDWYPDSAVWTLSDGQLCGRGARNHPVWLKRQLPANARIEFDATSASADGDLKVEAWGDGSSGATGVSYRDATSYVLIFGGWKNRFHVLARLDEHAPDRVELKVDRTSTEPRSQPVVAGRLYHFKIERADGRTLRWFVDDIEMVSFADSNPLVGRGHDHFAFNDWEVPVCFDRLVITPLGSSVPRGSR
jgi:hypothetical protein